ncbi:MAG: glycosyltransferase family 39 protein [Candidatus Omnitrophica bacterium]|nr:glycosyltransferase family 39 protein [Candidatus Omnitrophota bacterium]
MLTRPRIRLLIFSIPFLFLTVSFAGLLTKPGDFHFPYDFWHEFYKLHEKTWLFLASLAVFYFFAKRKAFEKIFRVLEEWNDLVFLVSIFFAAFLLRITWCVWVDNQPFGDGIFYLNAARSILRGTGFANGNLQNGFVPTAVAAPGYSVFLAFLIRLFGDRIFPVEVAQSLLSASNCCLVYGIAKKVFGKIPAILASLTLMGCVNAITVSALYRNEHIYLPLTLGAIYFLVSDLEKESWLKIVIAGILLGLSDLSRGIMLSFPVTLPVFYLLSGKNLWRGLAKPAVILFGVLAVVLPWTYRNYQVLGYPIMIASSAGAGFYTMNSPVADPYVTQLVELEKEVPDWRSRHPNEEVARCLVAQKRAMDWIRSDFWRFMRLGAGKLISLYSIKSYWSLYENFYFTKIPDKTRQAVEKPLKKLSIANYAFHFWWFLVGVFVLFLKVAPHDRIGKKILILFVILYLTGIHYLFCGEKRYRYAVEPFIYIISTFAIVYFIDKKRVSSDASPASSGH